MMGMREREREERETPAPGAAAAIGRSVMLRKPFDSTATGGRDTELSEVTYTYRSTGTILHCAPRIK